MYNSQRSIKSLVSLLNIQRGKQNKDSSAGGKSLQAGEGERSNKVLE